MRAIWLLPALWMLPRRNGCERSTVLHSIISKYSLVTDECNGLSNIRLDPSGEAPAGSPERSAATHGVNDA